MNALERFMLKIGEKRDTMRNLLRADIGDIRRMRGEGFGMEDAINESAFSKKLNALADTDLDEAMARRGEYHKFRMRDTP